MNRFRCVGRQTRLDNVISQHFSRRIRWISFGNQINAMNLRKRDGNAVPETKKRNTFCLNASSIASQVALTEILFRADFRSVIQSIYGTEEQTCKSCKSEREKGKRHSSKLSLPTPWSTLPGVTSIGWLWNCSVSSETLRNRGEWYVVQLLR